MCEADVYIDICGKGANFAGVVMNKVSSVKTYEKMSEC